MEPESMGTNFSIKNVPADLAADLRLAAARNHRSIQGELMAMLEERLRGSRQLTLAQAAAKLRRLGVSSEGRSADIVRELRDHDAR